MLILETEFTHAPDGADAMRWQSACGRMVLRLDLEGSKGGEFPWTIEVDGEFTHDLSARVPQRFSHPWNAVRKMRSLVADRRVN